MTKYLDKPLRTNIPCHTQHVERGVKLTSESVGRVTGHLNQVGMALATKRCREEYPGMIRARKLQKLMEEASN